MMLIIKQLLMRKQKSKKKSELIQFKYLFIFVFSQMLIYLSCQKGRILVNDELYIYKLWFSTSVRERPSILSGLLNSGYVTYYEKRESVLFLTDNQSPVVFFDVNNLAGYQIADIGKCSSPNHIGVSVYDEHELNIAVKKLDSIFIRNFTKIKLAEIDTNNFKKIPICPVKKNSNGYYVFLEDTPTRMRPNFEAESCDLHNFLIAYSQLSQNDRVLYFSKYIQNGIMQNDSIKGVVLLDIQNICEDCIRK